MTLMEQANEEGQKAREALHAAARHVEALEMLVMKSHRAGFTEALDMLGVPEAPSPMERVALAR